jgi:hypothetical protein
MEGKIKTVEVRGLPGLKSETWGTQSCICVEGGSLLIGAEIGA